MGHGGYGPYDGIVGRVIRHTASFLLIHASKKSHKHTQGGGSHQQLKRAVILPLIWSGFSSFESSDKGKCLTLLIKTHVEWPVPYWKAWIWEAAPFWLLASCWCPSWEEAGHDSPPLTWGSQVEFLAPTSVCHSLGYCGPLQTESMNWSSICLSLPLVLSFFPGKQLKKTNKKILLKIFNIVYILERNILISD